MIEYKYNSDGDYFDGDRKRAEKEKAQQKKRFASWSSKGKNHPLDFPPLSNDDAKAYCDWGKRLLKKNDEEFLKYWHLFGERVMASVGDRERIARFVAIAFTIVAVAREELTERGGGNDCGKTA